MKLKLTPEAHRKIVTTLTENGFCDLKVTRHGNDMITIALAHNGDSIMEVDYHIPPGSSLTVQGLKIKLDLEVI